MTLAQAKSHACLAYSHRPKKTLQVRSTRVMIRQYETLRLRLALQGRAPGRSSSATVQSAHRRRTSAAGGPHSPTKPGTP